MRFYTSDWNAKRHAKRLKKVLRSHGYDETHTACLNLMARLYGFAHFSELQNSTWDSPSRFDEYVDDEILEARFLYQECVMAEEGFATIAGAVLDEVNPTGSRNHAVMFDEEVTPRQTNSSD